MNVMERIADVWGSESPEYRRISVLIGEAVRAAVALDAQGRIPEADRLWEAVDMVNQVEL